MKLDIKKTVKIIKLRNIFLLQGKPKGREFFYFGATMVGMSILGMDPAPVGVDVKSLVGSIGLNIESITGLWIAKLGAGIAANIAARSLMWFFEEGNTDEKNNDIKIKISKNAKKEELIEGFWHYLLINKKIKLNKSLEDTYKINFCEPFEINNFINISRNEAPVLFNEIINGYTEMGLMSDLFITMQKKGHTDSEHLFLFKLLYSENGSQINIKDQERIIKKTKEIRTSVFEIIKDDLDKFSKNFVDGIMTRISDNTLNTYKNLFLAVKERDLINKNLNGAGASNFNKI